MKKMPKKKKKEMAVFVYSQSEFRNVEKKRTKTKKTASKN
jgi:hypothetical protein